MQTSKVLLPSLCITFVAKFGKKVEICKQFAEKIANSNRNVTRCCVVRRFPDLEVMSFSHSGRGEARFCIDSKSLSLYCVVVVYRLFLRY